MFRDAEALDAFLAEPTPELVADLASVPGDILVLGVAGKMGPTLARLARRAGKRVVGVARFSEAGLRTRLEGWGVETIACDLLDPAAVARLPECANLVFMAGMKFGATGAPAMTWAMNAHVPALVAERFRDSRIVAFSTGNVYPLQAVGSGGATERTPPGPVGEYAQSCLGRERMFEHFSERFGTAGRLFRLNYAIDLRYGVLHDLARKVMDGVPVDVAMGHVNVIWQGDANAQALRCLARCTTPTTPLNCSGPETIPVRWLAEELGRRLGRVPAIVGSEAATAVLTNAGLANATFGYPRVALATMLDWTAEWVAQGGESLGKPTKFEVRSGDF